MFVNEIREEFMNSLFEDYFSRGRTIIIFSNLS